MNLHGRLHSDDGADAATPEPRDGVLLQRLPSVRTSSGGTVPGDPYAELEGTNPPPVHRDDRHVDIAGHSRGRTPESRNRHGRCTARGHSTPLTKAEFEQLVVEIADDILGYGPLEPFLRDPTRHRDHGQRRRARSTSSAPASIHPVRGAFTDESPLRRIIDKHRVGDRPPHRRVEPDGRRAPARRQPRQRGHPAAGARRPDAHDPQVRDDRSACRGRSSASARSTPARCRVPRLRASAAGSTSSSRGGTGSGKTTLLNVALGVHPGRRAHRHHRGRGRTAAAAGPRRLARDAPAEHRGPRRGHASATSCATRCACVRTGSSSVRSAAARRSTCSRR